MPSCSRSPSRPPGAARNGSTSHYKICRCLHRWHSTSPRWSAQLASGKQASAADAAVIQNISAQASRDLNLLQSFYSEYKANPNGTTLQKIQNVISDLNQNLPALLQSAHIGNPVLSARITAAVNLILTTVNSFAALMPQASSSTSQKTHSVSPPGAKDLRKQWNQQVCASTGNAALDEAFAQSRLR